MEATGKVTSNPNDGSRNVSWAAARVSPIGALSR